MGEVLEEIRSGRFAEEWSHQQADAAALFEKIRRARESMPFARWEDAARSAFHIGDAAGDS